MPFERILIAVDGSEGSKHALAKGLELAAALKAGVVALAVEGPLPAYAATIGEIDEVKREKDAFFAGLIGDVEEAAADEGVAVEVVVRPGHAADLVVRVADEKDADLIVLGRQGHFVRDHLLGSTADRVAEHAHCPVMIVK